MVVVYVVLAVAVAAAIYFLFLRPAPSESRKELPDSRAVAGDRTQPVAEPAAAEAARERAKSSSQAQAAQAPAPADKKAASKSAAAVAPAEDAPGKSAEGVVSKKVESSAPASGAISDSSISLKPEQQATEPDKGTPEKEQARELVPSGPPSVVHVRNVEGLRRGLEKSRGKEGFFGRLLSIFAGKKELDPELTNQIEEVLLASDVGTKTTESLLAKVREQLTRGELADTDAVWAALRAEILQMLSVASRPGAFSLRAKPTVVLLVGVNGVGKTTTIGKLATRLKAEGRQVILAAGDTFRAAAVQQLVVWGSRAGVEVVRGKDGADPGSVIFEAVQRAQQTGADVVLADTAGRLHTKSNLMAELKKVVKTTAKALDGAPHEILLVVDATNGQNAMAQAAEFQLAMPLTGVVLTKLDGTAKGGVVLGICDALKLPVRFVGLGETANDLHDFVPEEFVEALLGRDN
jgi:fused signal recognition particle receptor